MPKYGLFAVAFVIVTAGLVKSLKSGGKKTAVKKVPAATAYWPGVMRKEDQFKNPETFYRKQTNPPSNNLTVNSQSAVVKAQNKAKRGIASVAPQRQIIPASMPLRAKSVAKVSRSASSRNYTGWENFNYGYNSGRSPGSSNSNTYSGFKKASSFDTQELTSFTRTPDLSINPMVDPEITESFEDQVRKFREQNQLNSRELQELESITNSFVSISGMVERGQITMPQVNAEAIKITRSFINLKRRVEKKSQ